jgi:integrase
VLAMVLDHARVEPNPARDRLTVKLPREERRELQPPTAEHVEAVVRLLPKRYRLPALVLDATGMRIGELEALTWGDVDEPRQPWRVSAGVAKTGRARWVPVASDLFRAVTALVARDDRVAERPVFQGFGGDRFRAAITRACTAADIPAFSPHDLRHRRVSLMHLAGVPWARIGEQVGHDDITTTARTYTHTLVSEDELDYAELLSARRRSEPPKGSSVGVSPNVSAAESGSTSGFASARPTPTSKTRARTCAGGRRVATADASMGAGCGSQSLSRAQ